MSNRICMHGSLQRACETCDRDEKIATLESRLAAAEIMANTARLAVATLRDRDRTTHRGLQWAHDAANALEASLNAFDEAGR